MVYSLRRKVLCSSQLSVSSFLHPEELLDVAMAQTFRSVAFADEMNPSRRNTMEDAHRIVPNFDNDPSMSFFAVYDGHGGRGIVDFLETRLEQNIATELRVNDSASVKERLERAYLTTDIESKAANLVTSGATAVTCLLRREESGLVLHTANLGDSRAVLCQGGATHRLTYDHKAEDKAEQARIEAAGGFILRNRVLGILAVSRSFGDHGMKEFVCAAPYVSRVSVNGSGPDPPSPGDSQPFLIIACDGVWDVLSDEESAQLVAEEQSKGNEAEAAQALVQESLRRGSTDNITVIVVYL